MQQSGASRRLSSCWAQPAGRLRGVLVKRGTDEASVHPGVVRHVLGLHPSRRIPSPLPGRGRRPWARVDPRRNPLPLLCLPTPSATLTLFRERNVRAGWLRWHTSYALCILSHSQTGWKIGDSTSQSSRFTLVGRHRCYYYVINFQYSPSKTKTADGRMRHCEVQHDWLTSSSQALLSRISIDQAFQRPWMIRQSVCRSNKRRPFRRNASDWPVALSVLSRGIVLMISLDKTQRHINKPEGDVQLLCKDIWIIFDQVRKKLKVSFQD